MRTNIEIEEDLITKAMAALKVTTKREAVQKALERVVAQSEQIMAQQKLKQLRGMGWDGNLDEMRRD